MKKVFMTGNYVPTIKETFEKKQMVCVGPNRNELDESVDYAFSINFEPEIAEACAKYSVKYISWVVDSPHTVLFSKKVNNELNYIFLFDYQQFSRMEGRAEKAHIFYLPLATPWELFAQRIAEATTEAEKYQCEVSFLGRLYKDKEHALYDYINTFTDYLKGYYDSMMNVQKKMWGTDLLREAISGSVWEKTFQCVKWDLGDDYEGHEKETMLNILYQKLAQLERMEVCDRLAEQFDFCLYTQDDTAYNPKIQNKGYADYVKDMPLVFHESKININITLRSIGTGIPLRCLDIMGCGGFLLTNYQVELAEYFNDGEHLVFYSDFDDMEEKIKYYLEHEEERKQIAANGMALVREQFTYEKQIGKILEVMGE